MSKVFIEESTLTAIGDSIRAKTGKTDMISPLNMPTEIESIKGGGGDAIIETVEGVCPVILEDCVEKPLLDYKIYGAEGGVGDQTENIFDKHYDVGYTGTAPKVIEAPGGLSTEWYKVSEIGTKFTCALNPKEANTAIVVGYICSDDKKTIKARIGFTNAANCNINEDDFKNFVLNTTAANSTYIKFYALRADIINDVRIYRGIDNNLTTPYGFYFPIKINDTEHKLLLDINNSLIDGDYLDYENRCVVRSDGTKIYLDLPEIPLIEGTNTFDIETVVKPSNISLTYVKSVDLNTIKTTSEKFPLTVESMGQRLEDYKIYGAEGGVGNKTKNFFNPYTLVKGYSVNWDDGSLTTNTNGSISDYIDIGGASKITVTILTATDGGASHPLYFYDADKNYIQISDKLGLLTDKPTQFSKTFTVPEGAKYCRFYILTNYSKGNTIWAQVEVGDTFTGYVPFGYEIPIKVNDNVYTIQSIYPQLGNGDYIDFENRKVVIGGVEKFIDLPEIYLPEGINTIDVNTTIKPSRISLTYARNLKLNTMKTVEGTLPLTVRGLGQKLENYKIYGAYGESIHYGSNNEYIGYNYITTNQNTTGNKAGFNSGIKWNEVNKFRFSIRNNTNQENNMIFAGKATNENVCSALVAPWIGLGQVKYQSQNLTSLTYENHPNPGTFGIDTLKFATPTSENYIWVASWMDSTWSRNNDWGFVEFYKDDTLVASFHPAKRVSDGVFGFYNTVSGDFITCNAAETTGFVGNAELAQNVGDLNESYYQIPVKINDQTIIIQSPYSLGANDYLDFESRMIVKDGVETLLKLPNIHLENGINTIDVNTTVKPSKMSISYVTNTYNTSHMATEFTEFVCENEKTIYSSACEQVIKLPHITNPSGTFAYRWNQLNDNGYISTSTTQNGITFTNIGNGKLALSGTATARAIMPVVSSDFMKTWDTSHKYYLRQLYPGSSTSTVFWHTFNAQVKSTIILGSDMNFTANYPRVSVAQNCNATGIEITPQIFDLTMMFGAGNEPTMEQFEAMFPESYYPFNEGVDVYNLPITINGITTDYKYKSGMTEFDLEDKIIIPEGDSTISLPGTLSGTYLKLVSQVTSAETIEDLINQQLEVIENGTY